MVSTSGVQLSHGKRCLAMETEQFQSYLKVLAKAKNDNEKFAALLMVIYLKILCDRPSEVS